MMTPEYVKKALSYARYATVDCGARLELRYCTGPEILPTVTYRGIDAANRLHRMAIATLTGMGGSNATYARNFEYAADEFVFGPDGPESAFGLHGSVSQSGAKVEEGMHVGVLTVYFGKRLPRTLCGNFKAKDAETARVKFLLWWLERSRAN